MFYLHYQNQPELLEYIEKEVLKQTFQNLKALDMETADTNAKQHLYSFVILGSLSFIIDWINRDFNVLANKLAGIIYHTCQQVVPS
ncbi:MAG: TetR/AcrR family transcriptional regulator C-terminal domain-containing protein [Catonella sp.]